MGAGIAHTRRWRSCFEKYLRRGKLPFAEWKEVRRDKGLRCEDHEIIFPHIDEQIQIGQREQEARRGGDGDDHL